MRILWITNLPLAEAQEYLFHTNQSKEGWLVQLASKLSQTDGIELYISSRTTGLSEEKQFSIGNIHYHCFPRDYDCDEKRMQEYWKRCNKTVSPDIVHIHGTECNHSVQFVKACPEAKTVVSIQGLVSVISRYYYGGLQEKELLVYQTLYRKLKGLSISMSYHSMCHSAQSEKYILQNVKYAIGRTEWDRIHVTNINPDIHYFIGNETMRPLFYTNRWVFDNCEPHTIFVTQGSEPYKGFHQMLKALAIIKEQYPDVVLKVALLPEICKSLNWKQKLIASEYQLYLRDLVLKLNLVDNIKILGPLTELQMVEAMLSSNVFVSPSSIENSPNSLCEAQLLGMPAVASYVGGTPTIAEDGKATKLYRYDEFEMLASYIITMFDKGADNEQLEYARYLAMRRNDAQNNLMELLNIYNRINEQ